MQSHKISSPIRGNPRLDACGTRIQYLFHSNCSPVSASPDLVLFGMNTPSGSTNHEKSSSLMIQVSYPWNLILGFPAPSDSSSSTKGHGILWIAGGFLVENSIQCLRGDTLETKSVSSKPPKRSKEWTYLSRLPSTLMTPSKCRLIDWRGKPSPGPAKKFRCALAGSGGSWYIASSGLYSSATRTK